MVGHGHFRQRIWRGHIEAGDVEFGEVAIGDDVVTSRVGDIFQSLQRLALVAENVQDGSLEDGVQVPVDSYPPVSYTHLDVYKRQIITSITF